MRSPSNGRPPSAGGGAPAAAAADDDDFAFYCSFLQDAAPASATSPLALALDLDLDDPNPTAAGMTNGRRRKQRGAADESGAAAGEEVEEGVKKEGKKRSIAKLLTSLAALEAEEHADRADASRRELALLESNADTRSQAMMDYYAKMESSFDATAESEASDCVDDVSSSTTGANLMGAGNVLTMTGGTLAEEREGKRTNGLDTIDGVVA